MPLNPYPITPPPGVVLNETDRVIEGRWKAATGVRFSKGRPQKLGGWTKAFPDPTSGAPRTIHAWRDIQSNPYLAAGTYRKLYVYDPELEINDITPFRSEGTLGTDPLTVTNGSPIVTVSQTAHGLSVGDTIILTGATAVGGITPDGTFIVNSVPDGNTYTYIFTSNATSGATGGGSSIDFQYEIPIGVELGTYGLGYGVGGYGLGTYGTARDSSTIYVEPRVWALDHLGIYLIACYNGSTVYEFDPTASQPWDRAEIVDVSAPDNVRSLFVTPERFIMALCDDMQVAWPSQGSRSDWTPSLSNTANIRTLSGGTKLVAGRVLSDFVSLIWSDAALFRFQYTGSSYVYNSSMVGKDCGLIGPNAVVTAGGVAYWQGHQNFLMYQGGTVMPMPNTEDVRSFVFSNLSPDNGYQCSAVYNPKHNEVWFTYTLEGETNPTVGVIYSIDNQCWTPMAFGRVSGTHFDQGDTRPYMGHSDGYIYKHEDGHDADGASMPWSLELAPYALAEGLANLSIRHIIMDMKEQVGDVTVELTAWDRLNDTDYIDRETETMVPADSGPIDFRTTGRYVGVKMSCDELGSYMRVGKPVALGKPYGRRP